MSILPTYPSSQEASKAGWFSRRHRTSAEHMATKRSREVDKNRRLTEANERRLEAEERKEQSEGKDRDKEQTNEPKA